MKSEQKNRKSAVSYQPMAYMLTAVRLSNFVIDNKYSKINK